MSKKREQRKLLRKRQQITFLIIFFLFCTLTLQVAQPSILEAYTPGEYIAVIVEDGDSLWKIAERFVNNQMDIRHYINLIQEHNRMKTVDIYPGEIIEIPLYAYR
jgi:hypothetical protein